MRIQNLQIGDHVSTELTGRTTIHSIVARRFGKNPWEVEFRILPSVEGHEWIDTSEFKYAEGFDEKHRYD